LFPPWRIRRWKEAAMPLLNAGMLAAFAYFAVGIVVGVLSYGSQLSDLRLYDDAVSLFPAVFDRRGYAYDLPFLVAFTALRPAYVPLSVALTAACVAGFARDEKLPGATAAVLSLGLVLTTVMGNFEVFTTGAYYLLTKTRDEHPSANLLWFVVLVKPQYALLVAVESVVRGRVDWAAVAVGCTSWAITIPLFLASTPEPLGWFYVVNSLLRPTLFLGLVRLLDG